MHLTESDGDITKTVNGNIQLRSTKDYRSFEKFRRQYEQPNKQGVTFGTLFALPNDIPYERCVYLSWLYSLYLT